jgi:hypothetical protein
LLPFSFFIFLSAPGKPTSSVKTHQNLPNDLVTPFPSEN